MQLFVRILRKISTRLVFKVSGVFVSNLGQKFEIVSSLESVQHRIPAAFFYFSKAYRLNH
jgi:hypothetical protein